MTVVDGPEQLESACSGQQIVTDFVQQHEYAQRIAPGSANTLRVLALRESDSEEVFVPVAVHRFGVAASAPVDNFASGGLSAGVDVATGRLAAAVVDPGPGRSLQWVDRHPETGAQIAGVRIPHWDAVIAEVRRLGGLTPGFDFVGWDVIVTDSGFSILEGNNRPDINLQVHGPLLLDERVRRFLRTHQSGKEQKRPLGRQPNRLPAGRGAGAEQG